MDIIHETNPPAHHPPGMRPVTPIDLEAGIASAFEPEPEAPMVALPDGQAVPLEDVFKTLAGVVARELREMPPGDVPAVEAGGGQIPADDPEAEGRAGNADGARRFPYDDSNADFCLFGMRGLARTIEEAIHANYPESSDLELLGDIVCASELLHRLALSFSAAPPVGLDSEQCAGIEGQCAALHLALLQIQDQPTAEDHIISVARTIPPLRDALGEAANRIPLPRRAGAEVKAAGNVAPGSVGGFVRSYPAGNDIPAHRAVLLNDGLGYAVLGFAGPEMTLGVAPVGAERGAPVDVALSGVEDVETAGPVPSGAYVEVTEGGRIIEATLKIGYPTACLGRTLGAATAAGERVPVLISPAKLYG